MKNTCGTGHITGTGSNYLVLSEHNAHTALVCYQTTVI